MLFIKSFEVVGSTCDLFKIKIIGNDDRINYLEVNILEVIKINELDKFIDPNDLNQIIREVYQKALADLKVSGKTLIVLPENNKNVLMSSRNIEGVKTITANNINVFDLLKYTNLILPVDTVKKLEEVYA